MGNKTQFKTTGINMISGGVGFFLPMLINFLVTPILFNYLGSEAFGLQSLVNVILGYLMVADMGLDIPITKFLSEYKATGNINNRDRLLSSTFQIYSIIGLLGFLVILTAEPFLYDLFSIPVSLRNEAQIVFWITGIGFFGSILSMWGKAVFIGVQRYDIANGIYVASNLIGTISGIILVYQGMGIVYFVLAKVIAFFLAAISYWICARRVLQNYKFSFGFDKTIIISIRSLIGYGFLLRISGMIFSKLDQTLISAWVGIGAVGAYSIPLIITTAVAGLIGGVMNFTFPRSSELYSTNKIAELHQLYLKSTKYVSLAGAFFFSFIIATGNYFILLWINADFAARTHDVLIILSFAYLLNTICSVVLNNFVISMNGMLFFTGYGVIRSLVMALGFILLVKPFGIEGAALGILFACACDVTYLIISLRRYFGLHFKDIFVMCYLLPLLMGLLAGGVIYLCKHFIEGWISFIVAGICYSFMFVCLGIVLRVFDDKEKDLVRNAFVRVKNLIG